ncbi:MAG: hypothetical protein Q9164_003310 [Protoblastenia rupestris]
MALFRGQEQRQRVANVQSRRGRYQGYNGSRKGGQARGAPNARARNRNTFSTSRVEEQPEDTSDRGSRTSESEIGENSFSKSESESDEEKLPTNSEKPYNILLQNISTNVQRQEPPQKKRKVERVDAQAESRISEVMLDEMSELEEQDDDDDENPLSKGIEEHETHGLSDPFVLHFADVNGESGLSEKVADIKGSKWHIEKGPKQAEWSYSYRRPESTKITPKELGHTSADFSSIQIKGKLKAAATVALPRLSSLLGHVTSSIFNYQDLFFPLRKLENADTLRTLVCLHSLNHVCKTRDTVIKNNARLAREDGEADLELRDQGFTRPKVLIILPTRQSCVRYVEKIISLWGPEQQENKNRFQDTYVSGEDHFSDDKPDDFRELFAGNDDDMFRLGMKFTRKTVKFFSQFYKSDIIFASPLGLRMALGADDPKKQDNDFLSSIEIVIVDQADALAMQNWEHVEYIFEKLNLQPKEAHGCDFSRVRNWYLDGSARYLRQTICYSAFNFPSLNKLFIQHMQNVDGKVKYFNVEGGAMIGMDISPKQTFSRFESASATSEPDDRFKYFSNAILPGLAKNARHRVEGSSGVLIYVPTYADFLRVRNYLATSTAAQGVSFGSISEYTALKDAARARSHFLSGRHSVLLYTERAHHFRRYHLKGVKRIVMYGLPENPIFYKEVIGGFLGASIAAARLDAREANVRILFSKLDILKLERIVGSTRYLTMLKDTGGDTFDFV